MKVNTRIRQTAVKQYMEKIDFQDQNLGILPLHTIKYSEMVILLKELRSS